jgi:hypothetical protein
MKNLIKLFNTDGYSYLKNGNLAGYDRYFSNLLRACTSKKQINALYAIKEVHKKYVGNTMTDFISSKESR